MDLYYILSFVIILGIIVVLVGSVRLYLRVRRNAGYHTGKMYSRGQHMGAYIGNYEMDSEGMEKTAGRIESDEEMYLFSDAKDE